MNVRSMFATVAVGIAALALAQSAHATGIAYYWNSGNGNWSDSTKWFNTTDWDGGGTVIADYYDIVDTTGVIANDLNPGDTQYVVADFRSAVNPLQTVTLDTNVAISALWYGWFQYTTNVNKYSGTYNLVINGPNTLTFLNSTGSGGASIITGRMGDSTLSTYYSLTFNCPIAGTNGLSFAAQTVRYNGNGVILGAANSISGPIVSYPLLTLTNVQAAEYATLAIAASDNLRLRSDTDGAVFLTSALAWSGHEGTASIDVDRNTGAGGTGHVLKLAGNFTITNDRPTLVTEIVNVTGAHGYGLELTGNIANVDTGSVVQINAVSANTRLSGSTFEIGQWGLQLGGTGTSGVNVISGSLGGKGPITKLSDDSTWRFSGNNTYTGMTTIAGGTLELGASGSISSSAVIRVLSGGMFDVTNVASFALATGQRIEGDGTVLGDLSAPAGSTLSPGTNTIATLTATGNVAVAGVWRADVNATTGTSDCLAVNGNLTLNSGSQLILATNGVFTTAANFTLATYSGTLTGTFGSVSNLPAKLRIDYGRGVNSAIRLCGPVSGTAVMFR